MWISLKSLGKTLRFINLLGYDGVRIRLKRGGHHGSESVSHRGVHHGHIRILQGFVFKKKRFSRTQVVAVLLYTFGASGKTSGFLVLSEPLSKSSVAGVKKVEASRRSQAGTL